MPIASCKNKIPTLFAMFLFRVIRMISPTPAPVDNPATSAGKDSAPVVKSSTSKTDDAQFAAAVDRLQPLLLNYFTNGASWVGRTVTRAQVYKRNELVKTVMPALWPFVEHAVETCYQKGFLKA